MIAILDPAAAEADQRDLDLASGGNREVLRARLATPRPMAMCRASTAVNQGSPL